MNGLRRAARSLFFIASLVSLSLNGCVHHIHVAPLPSDQATATLPYSVRVNLLHLSIEGADHMPGIPAFEWPPRDLRLAVVEYIRKRQTFTAVTDEAADLTLSIKSWLTMTSRAEYRYAIRLEAELGPFGKPPIKTYLTQAEEAGSTVRWVTASDQAPIERAVQTALDGLLSQIETDAGLYRK